VNERCLFCGAPDARRHHLTGRDGQGLYLDPDLRCRLCLSSCHPLAHDDWNTCGVRDRVTPATFLDSLELRLRRTALLLGRLAPTIPGPIGELVGGLAEALAAWALGLATGLAVLDATFPTWRNTPGL
jgi:hypothetical protein